MVEEIYKIYILESVVREGELKTGLRLFEDITIYSIHPQGIRGILSPAEINEILELTEQLAA